MAITPKEAFEAVKKLWPKATHIVREGRFWRAPGCAIGITYSADYAETVDWGDTTEYPVSEPKWRDARPEDVAYPFKEARFRDGINDAWVYGRLCGYAENCSAPWVLSNGTKWYMCQVRDEA